MACHRRLQLGGVEMAVMRWMGRAASSGTAGSICRDPCGFRGKGRSGYYRPYSCLFSLLQKPSLGFWTARAQLQCGKRMSHLLSHSRNDHTKQRNKQNLSNPFIGYLLSPLYTLSNPFSLFHPPIYKNPPTLLRPLTEQHAELPPKGTLQRAIKAV